MTGIDNNSKEKVIVFVGVYVTFVSSCFLLLSIDTRHECTIQANITTGRFEGNKMYQDR